MAHVPVLVVGAGPAGLAMSHHLTTSGIDHLVVERGEVAGAWRTERWDSLRLLTPNWMCRLPGHAYAGDDPDGFMTAAATAALFDDYRRSFDPPVITGVTVEAARRTTHGFDVITDHGRWCCDVVVAATGASSVARVPPLAADLPSHIGRLTALEYRRPDQLDASGEVLVVGASASGVQIADELRRSGRAVTVAVGEHVRVPRTYRGRDIYWWLDAIGQLDERYDAVDDVERARRHASVQLVGSSTRATLDLNALMAGGVRLVGRLARVIGERAQFSGALANLVDNADLKQARLLARIDEHIVERELTDLVEPAEPPARTRLATAPTELDLTRFSSLVWATGYRPATAWLDPAALDQRSRVRHDGGVGSVPGLFHLGLPFMRRRRSNLIAGVGDDAADLLGHVRAHLDAVARPRPASAVRQRQQRSTRPLHHDLDRT